MAYDQKFPTDDGYLADFPPGMREQIRAIVEDMVVNALALQGLTPGNASGNIPVSNGTKCTNLNAELHGGNLPSAYAVAGHVHSIATDSSNGLMSNTDKTKLDGIATGAKVNQNAFSNILVGTTTIQADSETDTFEIVAGTNVSIVPDATNDRITINNTYAHPTGDGNIHVPATGTANSGKVLTAGATAGSLSWTTPVDATKAPINHSSTATTYGISSATEYGHVMASSATPLAAGTAAVGTDNGNFAREGHVHPAQTTITGNAGTATKLETARTISLTGNVTGSATFDGSVNASITATVKDDSHTHTSATVTGLGGIQLFTSSGTFTVPTGITAVRVTVVGGGGGGGGNDNYWQNYFGSGGGSGAIAERVYISGLTPGANIAVTVGSGGAGGASAHIPASATVGGNGGTSSFGAYVSCSGGYGGILSNGVTSTTSKGGTVPACSYPGVFFTGGDAVESFNSSTDTIIFSSYGAIRPNAWYYNATNSFCYNSALDSSPSNAKNANVYGAGGCGRYIGTAGAGGNGASGYVLVEW